MYVPHRVGAVVPEYPKYYARYGNGLESFGVKFGDLTEIRRQDFLYYIRIGYPFRHNIVDFYL